MIQSIKRAAESSQGYNRDEKVTCNSAILVALHIAKTKETLYLQICLVKCMCVPNIWGNRMKEEL
jgi:hypothetical protein